MMDLWYYKFHAWLVRKDMDVDEHERLSKMHLNDWYIVSNATFSNISAILWRPVLVVEDILIGNSTIYRVRRDRMVVWFTTAYAIIAYHH